MNNPPFLKYLACPLDGLVLVSDTKSLRCAMGHCFDFDRRGAVNLLPVQFKASLSPGDSLEMVAARNLFLDAGFYRPIAEKLAGMILPGSVVFDAGCGTGYYTDILARHVANSVVGGMDISKDAVSAASKRNKDIAWFVGTNKKIPVRDASVDVVTSLFGFPVWEEFKRILKPNECVITVDPGANHLIELRRVLYPEIKESASTVKDIPGFELTESAPLTAPFSGMNKTHLEALLWMTPHGFRATPERRAAALGTVFPSMTLDVVFRIYKNSVA